MAKGYAFACRKYGKCMWEAEENNGSKGVDGTKSTLFSMTKNNI